MAWWSSIKRRSGSAVPERHHVLVISDIHLGEDILVEGPEVLHTYIRALNGTLMGFLAAHRDYREDGRPWHLVINGDLFDFLKMPLAKAEAAHVRPGSEVEALRKLDRIVRIHRPFFMALAQFLLAGHKATLIEGNHDAEFFFEAVRQSLRQHVVRLAASHLRRTGLPPTASEQAGERLLYSSWFVAEVGYYHIEHGHQYDRFSSFEHKLAPLEAASASDAAERILTSPMSHRLLPQVAELLGNFSTHGITELRPLDAVRMVRRWGFRVTVQLVRAYLKLCGQLLGQSGRKRQRALQQAAESQASRLRVLCAESCYSAGVLRALDKRKAMPAEYQRFAMLHLFWVDRMGLIAFTLLVELAVLCTRAHPLVPSMALIFAAMITWLALKQADPPPLRLTLRDAAAHIAQICGAQYVVFGHSHRPESVDLFAQYGVGRANARPHYINGGSWVTREILRGDASEGMTYVKITTSGAQLMQWRGADRPPRCIDVAHTETAPSPRAEPYATVAG